MVEISELVVGMAKSNPKWGYTRIRGALSNLGHTRPVQKHKRTQDWRGRAVSIVIAPWRAPDLGVSEAMSAIRVPRTRRENTIQQRDATFPGGDLDPGPGRTWTRTC